MTRIEDTRTREPPPIATRISLLEEDSTTQATIDHRTPATSNTEIVIDATFLADMVENEEDMDIKQLASAIKASNMVRINKMADITERRHALMEEIEIILVMAWILSDMVETTTTTPARASTDKIALQAVDMGSLATTAAAVMSSLVRSTIVNRLLTAAIVIVSMDSLMAETEATDSAATTAAAVNNTEDQVATPLPTDIERPFSIHLPSFPSSNALWLFGFSPVVSIQCRSVLSCYLEVNIFVLDAWFV
jgi:hypothetical protein